MTPRLARLIPFAPVAVTVLALATLTLWLGHHPEAGLQKRIPGTDAPPGTDPTALANPALTGKVTPGPGRPADLPGAWPQFRGPEQGGIAPSPGPLARAWDAAGPRRLWAVDVGEGYAGVAVRGGRVYLLDYDQPNRQSALRCLSLADGEEIWRYAYALAVKRNHGMTRTVPTLAGEHLVALDSKCNVFCLDATRGEVRWAINLVREHGATVPPWYAGQCPFVDGDRVILAPGGRDALLLAVELATGQPLWQTPNPRNWKMTHASLAVAEFGGRRQFIYCGSGGVAGVAADTGELLWDTTEWKISIATVPTPLVLPGGRLFLSGGYNAGAAMLQLTEEGGKLTPKVAFRLAPEAFGATQQTPILSGEHIFGVRPDGQFVCLDLSGKIVWASGPATTFGLGSFLLAGDLFFAVNDNGRLSLFEASRSRFNPLAQARVLEGRESWAPMALVGGRLLLRDLTKLACLDVAGK